MLMRVLILMMLTTCSFAQIKLVEVTREWEPKNITVHDGMVYKYKMGDDTARYYVKTEGEYEITVTFKRTDAVPDVIETVDDFDARIEYTPSRGPVNPSPPGAVWNPFTVQGTVTWPDQFHNLTGTFSSVAGQTAKLPFTGKKVQVFVEKSNNKGNVEVFIDGVSKGVFDTYDPTSINNSQSLTDPWVLPAGNHDIVLKVLGTKRAASTGTYFLLDKIVITR